jgi:peroxiredoxin
LSEKYRDRGVQALIIDVMETPEVTRAWAAKWKFTLPVLLDQDGKVAEAYAPAGVLPDLPRNQVPIASNLIIDRQGKIRFYTLLDTTRFDARLVELQARLDQLLEEK